MNERELNKLFAAASKEVPPAPPQGFIDDVLRQIRAMPREATAAREASSLADQLNAWFTRIALGAAALIALCVLSEVFFGGAETPSLQEEAAQVAGELLLPGGGI